MPIINPGDFPLDPRTVDGTELAARLNRLEQAFCSTNSNTTRPPYISAGGVWVQDHGVGVTPQYELMMFDGANDVIAGGGRFDAGTRLLFQQSIAPTGWTKITTINNHTLRVVSGSAGTGGSIDFTTIFAAGTSTGAHTLTTNELPAHNHPVNDPGHGHGVNDPGHAHATEQFRTMAGPVAFGGGGGNMGTGAHTQAAGTGISIQGSGSNISIGNSGGGAGHSHTMPSLDVKYVDVIICSKD